MNLAVLCKHLNNWFEHDKWIGEFTVNGGAIDLGDETLRDGQYYRIVGSVFNDGVHQHPDANLVDETFDGAVWPMGVPPAVLALVRDISAWEDQYSAKMDGPYTSESFAGYAYTKKQSASGSTYTWRDEFASRLNDWRKLP